MVSVIFAVLEVSFWALTTVVKLPWKFLTLINKKGTKTLYLTHMPRSPRWMDLYQIWYRGSSRGRIQLCGILLQSADGFLFCEGSKFAISHWLGRSPLKGHSGADWPVFFSRSIKSLIYNIFTYKVWTLNFYRKGQQFEVSFWRWEIPYLRTLPVGLAPSARWRLRFRPHCYDTTTYPR